MTLLVINVAAFQVTWFACVLGAAHGLEWVGPIVALGAMLLHLRLSPDRTLPHWWIPGLGLLGFLADSLLSAAGLLDFGIHLLRPWPCPLWIFGLWLGFATTLNSSLGWLGSRLPLAALLGLLLGPLAYYAAAELGAVKLFGPEAALLAVGIEWAVLLPAMLLLVDRMRVQPGPLTIAPDATGGTE